MAVIIAEPEDGYATWLAGALGGLTARVIRTSGPDEAMAALAAEGRDVLGLIIGPDLDDQDALALAGMTQQGAPDVSVLLIRYHDSSDLFRRALRYGVKDVITTPNDEAEVRAAAARTLEIARALRGRLAGATPEVGSGDVNGRDHRVQLQGRLRQDVPGHQPGVRPGRQGRRGRPRRPRPALR